MPASNLSIMCVHDLTDDTAQEFLSSHSLAFVLFKTPICGSCRQFEPVFARVAENHEDIAFCRVDSSASPGIRTAFGVSSVPHLAVVNDRELAFSHTGPLSEEALESVIRQVREQTGN